MEKFTVYILGDYYPITCLIGLIITSTIFWFEKRARNIEDRRKK